MAATIRTLGREVCALARIADMGELLGLRRSTSYRVAEAEQWPLHGTERSKRVIVPQLLDRLGIAFEYTTESSEEAGIE